MGVRHGGLFFGQFPMSVLEFPEPTVVIFDPLQITKEEVPSTEEMQCVGESDGLLSVGYFARVYCQAPPSGMSDD